MLGQTSTSIAGMESPSCQGRIANYAETATTLNFLDCMSHEEGIHESKILPLYHPAAWPLGSLASEEEVAPSLGITRRIAASSSTPVAPHRVSGCMTRHFTRSRSSKTWSLRSPPCQRALWHIIWCQRPSPPPLQSADVLMDLTDLRPCHAVLS